MQKALWDWVRKGDRRIFIQHSDKVAGEMVEALTWPFPIEADMEVPNQGVTKQVFPADTPFLGVVWEDWAWDLVKAGELRGYSIGGRARRIVRKEDLIQRKQEIHVSKGSIARVEVIAVVHRPDAVLDLV